MLNSKSTSLSTKLKCLVLDDELPGLTYLKLLCEQIPDIEVVRAFNHPLKLVEELPLLEFDCCIMDIEMPEMNGMQLAQLLRGKQVIFATAYKEYAAEAFDLDVVDYIRKPITRERLEKAILKLKGRLQQPSAGSSFLQLNSEKGKARVQTDHVVCITTAETDKRDKQLWFANGERLVVKNISFPELLQLLPRDQFCRISKGVVVALRAIRFFTREEVQVSTGEGPDFTTFTIGDQYRAAFVSSMSA